MNISKECFRHYNSDCGSKGIIIGPTKVSLFTVCVQHWAVTEVCRKEMKQRYHKAPCLAWWLVHSEHWSCFPQWCSSPETDFYWGNRRKRILGKFLWCDSGVCVPSNKLSLCTFRENILKTCSAPDSWDALCSLSSLQITLQQWKKGRTWC